MGVYGPFNASLNTVVKVTGIDVNADRVFIDNQSKYTLAIGFTPTQPIAVATLYGHPWYGQVPPGGKTIPIPRSAYNEQFPGYFWVLALDAIAGTRAYSGNISLNLAFFVQALVPGEPSPPDYAIPQGSDLTSQPRVITMAAPPNGSDAFQDSLAAASLYFPSTALQLWHASPVLPAGLPVNVQYFCLSMVTTAAAGSYADLSLVLRQLNGAGTEISNVLLCRFYSFQGEHFNPSFGASGLQIGVAPSAGVNTIELRIFAHAFSAAGTYTINWTVGATLDPNTGQGIFPVGFANIGFGNPAVPW